MSKCTNCGQDFSGNFCPYCGTKAQEVNTPTGAAAPMSNQPSPVPPKSTVPPVSPPPSSGQAPTISQTASKTEITRPVLETPAAPSFPQQTPAVPSVKVKQPKALLIFILILLILNLAATSALGVLTWFDQNGSFNRLAQQSKAYREYLRENGKSITVMNDEFVSSEYESDMIQGTLKNESSTTMENVSICIDFYNGDDYVDSSKDYIDKIPAGSEVKFDVLCPSEDFDSYAIVYIEAEK